MKKSIIQRTLTGLGLLGFTTMFAGTAHASLLANEAFDEYANGTTLTATGNWVAFSGAGNLPLTVATGTVTVTNLASGTSGEDDRLTFAPATAPATGTVYYSALITVPNGTTAAAAGDYFLSAYSTAGGYEGRVSLDLGTGGTGLAFGLSNNLTGAANITLGPTLTTGSEYRLVLAVNTATGTTSFNYQLASATPFADTSTFIAGGGAAGFTTGLDSVALRQGSAAGDAFTNIVDGIRVGTTLTDVSGIATGSSAFFNAVPEPSTYATMVAGAGLLGLALRARRKA